MFNEAQQNALNKSMRAIFLPTDFDGKYASNLFSRARNFLEHAVGASLMEFEDRLPHFQLNSFPDGKHTVYTLGKMTLRLVSDEQDGDENKGVYIVDTEGTPRFQIIIGHADDISQIKLCKVDPERPDDPYPEQVAGATVFRDGKLPRSHGFCALDSFGLFVEAMNMLRPMMSLDVDRAQLSPGELIQTLMIRPGEVDHGSLLREDGGLAGELSLHLAATVQNHAIKVGMDWARTKLPEVISELEDKGAVWGQSFLNYNDMDHSVCAISLDDGRKALVHVNASLISDYWGYIAVAEKGEQGDLSAISVYAVSRVTDHVPNLVEQLQQGALTRQPTIRHDFDTGQPSLCESIDHTGIAEGFIAYTSYDHEVLFNPGDRDEEYTKFLDFQEENYFDLHREDYDNDEDEAPSPGL